MVPVPGSLRIGLMGRLLIVRIKVRGKISKASKKHL